MYLFIAKKKKDYAISARIDETLFNRYDQAADECGWSKSRVAIEAVKAFVSAWEESKGQVTMPLKMTIATTRVRVDQTG